MGWKGVLARDGHSWLQLAKDMGGSSIMAIGSIGVRAHFLIIEMLTKMLVLGECWTWDDAVVDLSVHLSNLIAK